MFPQSYFWDNIVDQKDTWRVSSPDCTSSSACEPDVQGTVHLREVHRGFSLRWHQCITSGISGEFSVELPDARRIEGSSHAQVRNPSRKIICE
jgi:hypothetical protein